MRAHIGLRRELVTLVTVLLLLACTPTSAAPEATPSSPPLPTSTPFSPRTATPLPEFWIVHTAIPATLTPSPTATLLATATASPTSPVVDSTPVLPTATPSPGIPRPHYRLVAQLDAQRPHLDVEATITYPNMTSQVLSSLVLVVEPNRWPDCFTLQELTAQGAALQYRLQSHHLEVFLPQPLQPGEVLSLSLRFSLDLPLKRKADVFGYTSWQQNYVNWFPFVAPYRQGWVVHDPWYFGEHLVYDAADFDVSLKVPEGMIIAAPAPAVEENGWQHYVLFQARTFAFSVSSFYQVSELQAGNVPLRSYFFAQERQAAEHLLLQAMRALTLYSDHLAPYPYPVLSIVESDVPDGAEFDGLVFLSQRFYQEFVEGNRNNLVAVGIHEIAHQWWFGMVGNDAAIEPWLDEALALYTEGLFYEWAENDANWWWDFRVNAFAPHGYINVSIYENADFRAYVDAVYLRGAQFLRDVRTRMGDAAFFAFLQDYAHQMQGQIASREDFFRILSQHTAQRFDDLKAEYFRP